MNFLKNFNNINIWNSINIAKKYLLWKRKNLEDRQVADIRNYLFAKLPGIVFVVDNDKHYLQWKISFYSLQSDWTTECKGGNPLYMHVHAW